MAAVDPVWDERWKALEQLMNDLASDYGSTSKAMPWLKNLIERLRSFASDHFHFFYLGFGGKCTGKECDCSPIVKNHQLATPVDPDLSPEYVLTTILNQICADIEIIQAIAAERTSNCLPPGMLSTLQNADALIQAAFPTTPNLTFHGGIPQALAYFQKYASIRVIPYTSLALVGVHYTSSSVPRDLLVIPHEVGHFVYWNYAYNGRPIAAYCEDAVRDKLKNMITSEAPYFATWGIRWLEEIFADVYGCLLAGGVMANSNADLQLNTTIGEFVNDSDEHPMPVLRPNICFKVLQQTGTASQLKNSYAAWLDKRSRRSQGQAEPLRSSQGSLVVEDIISDGTGLDSSNHPIDAVIETLLKDVLKSITSTWPKGSSADNDDASAFNSPVGNVSAQMRALDVQPMAESEQSAWADWQTRSFEKPIADVLDVQPVPAATWRKILSADGWNTKITSSWGGR